MHHGLTPILSGLAILAVSACQPVVAVPTDPGFADDATAVSDLAAGLSVDPTPAADVPATGTARYEGYAVLLPGVDVADIPDADAGAADAAVVRLLQRSEDILIGELELNADFDADTLTGGAGGFSDRIDGEVGGQLAVDGAIIDGGVLATVTGELEVDGRSETVDAVAVGALTGAGGENIQAVAAGDITTPDGTEPIYGELIGTRTP